MMSDFNQVDFLRVERQCPMQSAFDLIPRDAWADCLMCTQLIKLLRGIESVFGRFFLNRLLPSQLMLSRLLQSPSLLGLSLLGGGRLRIDRRSLSLTTEKGLRQRVKRATKSRLRKAPPTLKSNL